MTIAEQIKLLQAKRKASLESLQSLVKTSTEESRVFTAEEQTSFDQTKKEIDEVDGQIARLEQMQKMVAETAEPVTTTVDGEAAGVQPGSNLALIPSASPKKGLVLPSYEKTPKGRVFIRFVKALAQSRGVLPQALEIAKQYKDTPQVEAIMKAAVAAGTTTDSGWASALAPYETAVAEFIDLLRPETLLGKMDGFRRVPFHIRVQRQTAGVTAGWVGEGSPKPVSKLVFDSFTIPETKLAVIVALTEELVRFSSPAAEAAVQQDMVQAVAEFMDTQFITPSIAESAGVHPGSILNGATSHASSGSDLDSITEDLTLLMGDLIAGNIKMRNRYWIMNPRTALFLMTLRAGTQGLFAFRDEMAQGRLLGIPYVTSNSVPLVSGDTIIALVETSEIYLADDGQTTIDISREASLQMDSAPTAGAASLVSLWQNNLVGIRAERYSYWLRRRAAAVSYLTGVAY